MPLMPDCVYLLRCYSRLFLVHLVTEEILPVASQLGPTKSMQVASPPPAPRSANPKLILPVENYAQGSCGKIRMQLHTRLASNDRILCISAGNQRIGSGWPVCQTCP